MAADAIDLDLLAASLRADLTDITAFVEGLAAKLEAALPAATVVKRGRAGLRGPKRVQSIALNAGGERLELRTDGRGSSIEATRAMTSGGIVLKTEQLSIDDWLATVVAAVGAEAQRSEQIRVALEQVLLGDGTTR